MSKTAGTIIKPKQQKLTNFFNLNRNFISGEKDFLYTKTEKILDVTGSYGCNLLGHQNKLTNLAADFLKTKSLSHTQGNIGQELSKLSEKFHSILKNETSIDQWNILMSSTGSEAVEISLKLVEINYKNRIEKIKFRLNEFVNKALQVKGLNRPLSEQVQQIHEENNRILNQKPFLIAIEGAFHGKTKGSLQLTANTDFSPYDDIHEHTIFLERNNVSAISKTFQNLKQTLIFPKIENGVIIEKTEDFYPISACFAEPIQGEAGVFELSIEFLRELRKLMTEIESLLVFDEIQSGSFRTGRLSSVSEFGIIPDVYIFGKAITGGFTKSSYLIVKEQLYVDKIERFSSSTFSDDDFSAYISRCFLEKANALVNKNRIIFKKLKLALNQVVDEFPTIFHEVRGRGLMLAIEINPELKSKSYEFKFFSDMNLFGYFIASALLENEQIRIAPTLSNQFTLRVQLSLEIDDSGIKMLKEAFRHLALAILKNDSKYFFGHIIDQKVGPLNLIKSEVVRKLQMPVEKPAVFLNHPITNDDLRKIFTAFENVPDDDLELIQKDFLPVVKFFTYFQDTIKIKDGKELGLVMLSLPITSKVLFECFKSADKNLLYNRLQTAIEFSQSIGASSIGLGQFTSIISKNGIILDSGSTSITTGNSYTAKLAYEAGVEICEIEKMTTGLVGFGGNIINTLTFLSIENSKKIKLLHRRPEIYPNKIKSLLIELINYCLQEEVEGIIPSRVKELYQENLDIEDNLDLLKEWIVVSNDLEKGLLDCDLVFTGTNSIRPIIFSDQLKKDSVVVDFGVPANIAEDIRSDVTAIKGGVAKINCVEDFKVDIPSFSLPKNHVYACIAETISIGLQNNDTIKHIGNIKKNFIDSSKDYADNANIELGFSNLESTF